MKTLVIYYSLTGSTQKVALQIKEALKADICEVKLVKPLPKNRIAQFFIGGMQVYRKIYPKILKLDCNIEQYDRIILGLPIWAGKCATPIMSLLRKYPVASKVEGIFILSGSTRDEKAREQLKSYSMPIKEIVSLYDYKTEKSKENAAAIKQFLKQL